MLFLGHALTGDRAGQRRAGQDASAGSSWELFLKDFGAKNHEKASQLGATPESCFYLSGIGVATLQSRPRLVTRTQIFHLKEKKP
jgi:hypothetical protein